MDYKGVECPVCKNRFTENDDIVVCPECGTPHHRACWLSLSHCVNEEKHADGFVFELSGLKQLEAEIFGDNSEEMHDTESSEKDIGADDGKNDSGTEESPVFTAPILGGMGQFGIDFGESAKIADIPINEASAFVGNDTTSTRLLLRMAFVDKFKSMRMNFVTLIFPFLWFFYRKMYKTGMLVIALMLVVTAVFTNANTLRYSMNAASLKIKSMTGEITAEQYNSAITDLAEKGTGNNYYYDMAPQVLNLTIRIVFALLANKLYLEHMKKQVLKTRDECTSMDEYMSALRRKGGKSMGAAVVSVIIYFAATFALYMLLCGIYHINYLM